MIYLDNAATTALDPEVIDAFFDCLDTLKAIVKRYPDMNGD